MFPLQKKKRYKIKLLPLLKPIKTGPRRPLNTLIARGRGHYKSECWAKGSGKKGGPKKPQDKYMFKSKVTINAVETELFLEDKSWAVIIKVDNAPNEGESYNVQSAQIASLAPKTELELYDSEASCHIFHFQHCFTNLRSIPL